MYRSLFSMKLYKSGGGAGGEAPSLEELKGSEEAKKTTLTKEQMEQAIAHVEKRFLKLVKSGEGGDELDAVTKKRQEIGDKIRSVLLGKKEGDKLSDEEKKQNIAELLTDKYEHPSLAQVYDLIDQVQEALFKDMSNADYDVAMNVRRELMADGFGVYDRFLTKTEVKDQVTKGGTDYKTYVQDTTPADGNTSEKKGGTLADAHREIMSGLSDDPKVMEKMTKGLLGQKYIKESGGQVLNFINSFDTDFLKTQVQTMDLKQHELYSLSTLSQERISSLFGVSIGKGADIFKKYITEVGSEGFMHLVDQVSSDTNKTRVAEVTGRLQKMKQLHQTLRAIEKADPKTLVEYGFRSTKELQTALTTLEQRIALDDQLAGFYELFQGVGSTVWKKVRDVLGKAQGVETAANIISTLITIPQILAGLASMVGSVAQSVGAGFGGEILKFLSGNAFKAYLQGTAIKEVAGTVLSGITTSLKAMEVINDDFGVLPGMDAKVSVEKTSTTEKKEFTVDPKIYAEHLIEETYEAVVDAYMEKAKTPYEKAKIQSKNFRQNILATVMAYAQNAYGNSLDDAVLKTSSVTFKKENPNVTTIQKLSEASNYSSLLNSFSAEGGQDRVKKLESAMSTLLSKVNYGLNTTNAEDKKESLKVEQVKKKAKQKEILSTVGERTELLGLEHKVQEFIDTRRKVVDAITKDGDKESEGRARVVSLMQALRNPETPIADMQTVIRETLIKDGDHFLEVFKKSMDHRDELDTLSGTYGDLISLKKQGKDVSLTYDDLEFGSVAQTMKNMDAVQLGKIKQEFETLRKFDVIRITTNVLSQVANVMTAVMGPDWMSKIINQSEKQKTALTAKEVSERQGKLDQWKEIYKNSPIAGQFEKDGMVAKLDQETFRRLASFSHGDMQVLIGAEAFKSSDTFKDAVNTYYEVSTLLNHATNKEDFHRLMRFKFNDLQRYWGNDLVHGSPMESAIRAVGNRLTTPVTQQPELLIQELTRDPKVWEYMKEQFVKDSIWQLGNVRPEFLQMTQMFPEFFLTEAKRYAHLNIPALQQVVTNFKPLPESAYYSTVVPQILHAVSAKPALLGDKLFMDTVGGTLSMGLLKLSHLTDWTGGLKQALGMKVEDQVRESMLQLFDMKGRLESSIKAFDDEGLRMAMYKQYRLTDKDGKAITPATETMASRSELFARILEKDVRFLKTIYPKVKESMGANIARLSGMDQKSVDNLVRLIPESLPLYTKELLKPYAQMRFDEKRNVQGRFSLNGVSRRVEGVAMEK